LEWSQKTRRSAQTHLLFLQVTCVSKGKKLSIVCFISVQLSLLKSSWTHHTFALEELSNDALLEELDAGGA
jgi:hypothetical protein